MKDSKKIKEFKEYVWSFYQPNEMYGEFFEHNLTKEELDKAVKQRTSAKVKKNFPFEGDSIDREIVRDIMFHNRGKTEGLEYNLKKLGAI